VVIGSGSGIGRCAARMMAAEGASVVAADIVLEHVEELVAEIRAEGGTAFALGADVSDESSVRDAVEAAATRLGGIDVLHNNAAAMRDDAGRFDQQHRIMDVSVEIWDRLIDVNLRGAWLMCKYSIPHMVAGGGGSIINTSAGSPMQPGPASGVYTVSKGGLNALTLVIATHYGRDGIRCNAIQPGPIDTGRRPDDFWEQTVRHLLVPQRGEPEDVGALAVYLASDESRYVTGQLIKVDGGFGSHIPSYADLVESNAHTLT
jgi:NAD(P)-dependent dehydrogenase (short-subunit alcohol dehydrogenase family)